MSRENSVEVKIKRTTIIAFIFILAVFVQAITAQYESSGFLSQIKYLICMIGVATCLIYMNKRNKFFVFKYEFKNVMWIIVVFAFISLVRGISSNHFTGRTIQELLFLIIPILYAYCLLNSLEYKTIDKCMFISLILCMMGYFIELDMNFKDIILGIKSMNFLESYSMLESSAFAGVSIVLSMYFIYFNRNRIGAVLSIVFVILTFKRLAIIFMLFILVIRFAFKCNKNVNRNMLSIIKVIVFGLGIGYFILMIPENVSRLYELYNIDMYKLTMARTYRFKLIYNSMDFINSGLGSTYAYTMPIYNVTLEMDFIKLLFEVTPVGVYIFVNNLMNIAKKNWYCMLLMLFQFFNMITSHSLVSVFSWLFFYITIGCIIYKENE